MSGPRDDGFLARWSRRKADATRAVTAPAVDPSPDLPGRSEGSARAPLANAPAPAAADATAAPAAGAAPAAPAPTLDDVETLTPSSDFTRFVGHDVDTGVRNAAMKKLFADPHFNVMDGLDTYIDDYNQLEPMPKSLLRRTMQARVLGLLDDELDEQPTGAAPPDDVPPPQA